MRLHLLLLLCLVLSIRTNLAASTNDDCPVILNPVLHQSDVDINENIIWESQPDENYYLSLGTTPNGKEIIDSLYLGNTNFYLLENLTHNTTYYANIQIAGGAINQNDCEPIIFTTGNTPIPDCSEILTPADGQFNVMLNGPLIWRDVDNIIGYYVRVGTTPGAYDVVNANIIDNNLYLDNLAHDTDYYVNIIPYNEFAVAVGCPEQRFTTIPAPPANTEFIITCPENITVIAPPGTNESIVLFDEPQVTHTCPENSTVNIQQIAGDLSGSSFPVGTTTIVYEVKLDCNNTIHLDTCSFEINVEADNTTNNCADNIENFTSLGTYNNHNYYQSNFQLRWQDASEAAAELGGYLVSIDSEEENKFIVDKIDKIVFIGLSDFQNEENNTWDSGDPISYDNFTGDNTEADDYGTINFWNGEWEFVNILVDKEFIIEIPCSNNNNPVLTANCGSSQNFIISETEESIPVTWQLPVASTTCPEADITLEQITGPAIGSNFSDGQSETITYLISDNCGNSTTCSFEVTAQKNQDNCPISIPNYRFLGEFNGHRYLQSEFQLRWQDASEAAAELGGYLVSIDSEEENKFIVDKIDKIVFIGLSDFQNEENNTWDSGDPISYDNFTGDNTEADDYGTINFWNGEWEFVNILVDKEFIIEIPCEVAATQDSQDDSTDPILTVNRIFPNPAADIIHLQVNAKERFTESIKLYNSQGQLQLEKSLEIFSGNHTINLNIKSLPKGIYFINVPGEKEELSWHKLIKL